MKQTNLHGHTVVKIPQSCTNAQQATHAQHVSSISKLPMITLQNMTGNTHMAYHDSLPTIILIIPDAVSVKYFYDNLTVS